MKIHIPTEQYGFIEVDVEGVQQAKMISDEVKYEFVDTCKEGLAPKQWNKAIDTYLTNQTLVADEYSEMNKFQKDVIQEVKRSFNRITYKEEKSNYEANRHQ